MNKQIIDWIKKELGSDVDVSREAHGDRSQVYRLKTPKEQFFLKVGSGFNSELRNLEWLENKLPVPKVIGFKKFNRNEALLLSAIKGKNLKLLCKDWSPEKVVDELVQSIKLFHSVNLKNCAFGTPGKNKVLIHGDASLPNFVFLDGKLSGFIDLGDVAVDKPDRDLAAAIWSLQYNLGFGYGKTFLEKYGERNVTNEMVETLRLKYEDMQEEWGL